MIRIIAVGKKHESWVAPGIERFETRLKQPWNVKWELMPHSSFEGMRAREDESERILTRLSTDDFIILLDERGKQLTSEDVCRLFEQTFVSSKPPVVIIGGAYGVTETLRERANRVVSLSKMVFPHQLVRLILVEQLYRSQEITRGSAYHHI